MGNMAEDLTGKRFGNLTVVRRAENKNGRTCWVCHCACGTEKTVTAHDLKSGKVKSCGSRIHRLGHCMKDLKGKRFGRLTAMYPTDRRDRRGSVYWHCVCDCGNNTEVTEAGLTHGNYKSCGCLKSENQKKISGQLHLIDGTCVELLGDRKPRKDNKSGFRGVYLMKDHRYRVDIGFKKKRFYVGMFDTFEDAVQARLEAEKMIHESFLRAYEVWKEQADADPCWAEGHPLKFEVKKTDGKLKILTE